jgi:DNA-binding MarR family transcriptional regulator
LSAKGYVSTSSDASHATKLILALSDAGLELYRETIPFVGRRQELLLKVLTLEERKIFDRALAKLQHRANEMLAEGTTALDDNAS